VLRKDSFLDLEIGGRVYPFMSLVFLAEYCRRVPIGSLTEAIYV
jgi:hypothetical protein